jgi:hypothetical protein
MMPKKFVLDAHNQCFWLQCVLNPRHCNEIEVTRHATVGCDCIAAPTSNLCQLRKKATLALS